MLSLNFSLDSKLLSDESRPEFWDNTPRRDRNDMIDVLG